MARFRGRSANWMPPSLPRQGMSARNVPRGSEDGVDLIWHRFGHVLQELPRRLAVCLLDELDHGELAGPVDAREEMELALGGLHLRDAPLSADCFAIACPAARQGHAKHDPGRGAVDVEEPDRLAFVLGPMADEARRSTFRRFGSSAARQCIAQRCHERCPRRPAGERSHAAAGIGTAPSASDAIPVAARHGGSRPTAAACAVGMPRPPPPRPRPGPSSAAPPGRSSDPRPSPVSATSRPSRDRCRVRGSAP